MTVSNHTPGPWRLKDDPWNGIRILGGADQSIARVGISSLADGPMRVKSLEKETLANAYLIAAAPMMRAALEVCFDYLTNREAPLPDRDDLVRAHAEAMGRALAAMNSADGEENE